MHPENLNKTFFHFSFLKDLKVHGIYFNSFKRYLAQYPFIRGTHFHDFYSVIIFTEGNGRFTICNNSHEVMPNMVFMIAPNQLHSFEGLGNTEGMIFFFCQDFYVEEFSFVRLLNVFSHTSASERDGMSPGSELGSAEAGEILTLFESVRKEYDSGNQNGHTAVIIRSLLNILLIKLSAIFDTEKGRPINGDTTFVSLLSHLIDSYFIKERHIGFYTEACHITEKRLNDICHRYFDCGLKKILHDRLMQESRRMLLSTELSVNEIAYKLNFEDTSYFNKVFRKSNGLTPKKFREMHKRFLP